MDRVLLQDTLARVYPTERHTATVIFFHGLGQSNVTWRILVTEAFASRFPHVLWILPQAPMQPVSLSQGQMRPSWFDLGQLPPHPSDFDEASIASSVIFVENLIVSQVQSGIDPSRIVLVGFSQGAALALMAALTTLNDLGGVASLSGWIPRRARDAIVVAQPNLPLFWAHGAIDEDIPAEFAREAFAFLHHTVGISRSRLRFRVFEGMGHAISDDELDDLAAWLRDILR